MPFHWHYARFQTSLYFSNSRFANSDITINVDCLLSPQLKFNYKEQYTHINNVTVKSTFDLQQTRNQYTDDIIA